MRPVIEIFSWRVKLNNTHVKLDGPRWGKLSYAALFTFIFLSLVTVPGVEIWPTDGEFGVYGKALTK